MIPDLRERETGLTVRRAIMDRLERSFQTYERMSRRSVDQTLSPAARSVFASDSNEAFHAFFKALADAGDFNHNHPEMPIPKFRDGKFVGLELPA